VTDRRYALGLLMAVGLFNYVDRLCMSILSVPIRRELDLTDTQLGVLTGLAFSLVYTLTAVPIARLADRGSRKRVIAACLALWSLMTAGCGLATGFAMLAVLRMGVALGEAGCVPATQALLSDYFPRQERARAIATWQLVFPVGTLVGFAASGWLNEAIGWRQAFLVLGGVGLALAPVVVLTLREPSRGAADGSSAGENRHSGACHPIDNEPGSAAALTAASTAAGASLPAAFRALWALRSYRYLTIGGAFIAWPLNAALYWNGQFYARVFGFSLGELAMYLALLSGGAGAVGLYGGGWLADRLGREDPRWQLRVPAIAGMAVVPCMLAQYFATDGRVSLALGVLPVILLNAFLAPQAAGAQSLASPNLRAQASATIVLISGTVGTAIGPFATGYLSDLIATRYAIGADSLRWSIGLSSLLAVVGGLFFLAASRHYAADLQRPARLD
jgi:MFS family permease